MRAKLIQDPRLGSVVLNTQGWVNRWERSSVLGEPPTRVLRYTLRTQFQVRGAILEIHRQHTLCEEPCHPRARNYSGLVVG